MLSVTKTKVTNNYHVQLNLNQMLNGLLLAIILY